MTVDFSKHALSFAAVDLQTSDLRIFLEVTSGLWETPKVRGEDTVVPARAGRVEGLTINDILPIELRGWIQTDPVLTDFDDQIADFDDTRTAIRELFHPEALRAELRAVLRNGQIYTIEAKPKNIIWNEIVQGLYAELSVGLDGFDDWAPGS